jgi:uncharacterized protein (UPF0335 family)
MEGFMARRNRKNVEPKIGQDGAALTADRKQQLAGYITEIERHESQKATIQADIGLCFNSAKDAGFDTKAMRAVLKDRKKSKAEREAFEAVVDVYKHALGMLADLPLGQAAMDRDIPKQPAAAH